MAKFKTDQSNKVRLPRVTLVLAAAIFVLGTSEFVIAGLLPELASDMNVSIPQAGYLISAFAVALIVGAPAMAVLTLPLPRRTTLVAALVTFVAAHVLGALAPNYAVLLVSRAIAAVAVGAFWAVAAVVAVSAAGPALRARALAVLLPGLSIANVAGVPLGTLLGQQEGWRATFWALAAAGLVGVLGVLATVPAGRGSGPATKLADEIAVFRQGRLWLALATIALYQAAIMATFSYIAPLLTEVSGLSPRWVPLVLLLFGLGGFFGVNIGGRFADAHPWGTLFTAIAAAVVMLVLLALFAGVGTAVVPLVALLGLVAFIAGAPLNARAFSLAGAAPTLASATNTSAFNTGSTIGPVLGGIAISAGWGFDAPPWLSAGLLLAAAAVAAVSVALDRAERAGTTTPAEHALLGRGG